MLPSAEKPENEVCQTVAANFNAACATLLRGDMSQAALMFETLKSSSQGTPLEVAVLHNHALTLEMQGLFGQALACYTAICNAHPTYTKSLLGAANCLTYLGEEDDALKLLNTLIIMQPDCVQAHIVLSQVIMLNGVSDYNNAAIKHHQLAKNAASKTNSQHTRYYAQCYYEHTTNTQYHMFAADSLLDTGLEPPNFLEACRIPDPDTIILTFTDSAYAHFACNMLESVKQNAPELLSSILVCCLDDRALQAIESYDDVCTCLCKGLIGENSHGPALYGSERFNKIVNIKVMLIQQLLHAGKQVLYCDSDIVILHNPMPDLLKHDTQVVIQADQTDPLILCTGFVFVKPTPLTIQVFDWTRIPPLCTSEQPVVNYLIKDLEVPYTPLDTRVFPSGKVWYASADKLNPSIVHYNWLSNDEKVDKMKHYGHWFTNNAGNFGGKLPCYK